MWWNRASCCKYDGKSMETETTTWSKFLNQRKVIVEQILVSEERNKFKRAGLWESQSRIQVGKLAIWVSSFEITQFTRPISSIRTGKPVLMMCIKASKDKHSRWVDWENLIYVRWNRTKNLCTKTRKVLRLHLRFLNLVLQTWITWMSHRFHHTSLNFSCFLGYFPCFSCFFSLFPILGLT